VELPYTLPQDSTLFLILKETSPDIWLRKLDWVAERGGMALINVHPDYVCMDGEQLSRRTFPVANYRQLLDRVRQRYGESCWRPLPGELATWYKGTPAARLESQPSRPEGGESPPLSSVNPARLRGMRAAVLLYSQFPNDPRPYRAARSMIEAGMEVDLLCLNGSPDDPRESLVDGVRVFRVPLRHTRGSKLYYFFNYGLFFATSFWFLTRRGLARRYDFVHVHNMPDFLVFAALIPKFRGARVILDLHDPMPELLMTIYGLGADERKVRWMRFLERKSIRMADLVLTPNIAFKRLFANRNGCPEKIHVIMNTPDEKVFDPDRFAPAQTEQASNGEFRIMHHGLIAYRHGIDLLVEAVAMVRPRIPAIKLDIYGAPTPFLATVLATAERLNVTEAVRIHGEKSQLEITDAIRECHLGVVPNRRSAFTEINFPTRLFEYLAMHRPVLAPSTQGILDYFSPEQMLMFNPDDVSDLAAKILWAYENPQALRLLVEQGNQCYRRHPWSGERQRFLGTLDALAHDRIAVQSCGKIGDDQS
jgi:glycosyltransferase involved in cell wall biosynthesis